MSGHRNQPIADGDSSAIDALQAVGESEVLGDTEAHLVTSLKSELELQKSNAALRQQLEAMTYESAQLKAKLTVAREDLDEWNRGNAARIAALEAQLARAEAEAAEVRGNAQALVRELEECRRYGLSLHAMQLLDELQHALTPTPAEGDGK